MNDFRAYIKFVGIENEDGSVAIDKASKSLLALNRWSLKYQKEFYPNQKPVAIKLKAVKRKCSLLELLINSPPIQTGIYVTIGSVAWKQLGFHEFCKKFMGTLGEQIALKKILKNDQPKSISKPYLKKNKIMVDLETKDGKKYSVEQQQVEIHRRTSSYLNGFNTLEKGQNTEMAVGYYDDRGDSEVASLTVEDKPYFTDSLSDEQFDLRMRDGFDEKNATEVTIFGRFLDYRGLATKYRFSFQARKNTKEYGKQKILCIIPDETMESNILDLLKPQNKKDIVLNGRATKDWEGNLDKLKVSWFDTNPNYNPDQLELLYTDNQTTKEDQ